MKRIALLLTTVLLAAVLLAGRIGTLTAEPENQIEATTGRCSNSETYTFVITVWARWGK